MKNGSETDVDCGGSDCSDCLPNQSCQSNSDCRSGQYNSGTCGYPISCKDIQNERPRAGDGTYTIDPDRAGSKYQAFDVTCDMTTDGGGWTVITPCLAQNKFNAKLVAEDKAAVEGIDKKCRPYTYHKNSNTHSYNYTFEFPAGFEEFQLHNYALKAAGPSRSDLNYKQTDWSQAYGTCVGGGWACGDISFGTLDQSGPVDSFYRRLGEDGCVDCVLEWPANDTTILIGQTTQRFRISWGEGSGGSEGWYPCWRGTIRLR